MSRWSSSLLYDLAHVLCTPACTLAFSLRIRGGRHIPARGGALLLANHQSYLDPVLVGAASPRRLCFLARKTLFNNPGFAWLLRTMNSVPVDQEGVAKEGLRTVLNQLQAGKAVLIFPEGNRTPDGRLQPLMPGVHLLLKRSHAPIVPVGIAGAYEALPRTRHYPHLAPLFLPAGEATVSVVFGKPLAAAPLLELSRAELLERLTEEMRDTKREAERLRRR